MLRKYRGEVSIELVDAGDVKAVAGVSIMLFKSLRIVSIVTSRAVTEVSNIRDEEQNAGTNVCEDAQDKTGTGTREAVLLVEIDDEKIFRDSPTKLFGNLSSLKTKSLFVSVNGYRSLPKPSLWAFPGAMPSPWCDSVQCSWLGT